MSVAKYCISLDWKKHILSGAGTLESPYVYGDVIPLDMNSVEAWMRANAGPDYCGNQAHGKLELWFVNEPAQEFKDAIKAHWDSLDEHSAEASAYVPMADRKAAEAAKATSGKAKLKALGLSDDEIAALLG